MNGLERHFTREATQMTNKHLQQCPALLIMRKMKFNEVLHVTIRWLMIKHLTISGVDEDVGEVRLPCLAGGNAW